MASIFDQARTTLKNLQNKSSKVVIQPQRNFVSQFGQSPVGKAITGFQRGIEQQTLPRVNLATPLTAGGIGNRVKPVSNPVTGLVNQFATSMGNDFVNIPQRLLQGGGRIGTQIVRPLQQGRQVNPAQAVGAVASAALPLVDIATLGGGTVLKGIGKQAAQQGGQIAIRQAIKVGAIQGAAMGGLYGVMSGAAEGKKAKLNNIARQGVGGAALGGLLGGAAGGIGGLISKTRYKPDVEKDLLQKAALQPRDPKTGKYLTDKLVKPKGMPEAQWNFQLDFNKRFNRNPYQPVYPDDLKKAVQFEAEKRGAGLSIRDVNKDINPLGQESISPLTNTALQTPSSPQITPEKGLDSSLFRQDIQTQQVAQSSIPPIKSVPQGKPVVSDSGEYLYHGTNEEVLDSISKEGLRPMGRGLLSLSKDESYAKNFARDGMTPQGKTNAVMFRVKADLLKGKTVSSNKPRPESDELHEMLTKEIISPEALEVKINGKWKPLSSPLPQGVTSTAEVPLPRTPFPQENLATEQPKQLGETLKSQVESAVSDTFQQSPPPSPVDPSSGESISQDPVQKIIQALKEAKPIRGQQEAMYSAERAKRVARVAGAGKIPGEKGYYAQLGALKGELPKVQFEGIRNKLSQDDINSVFNTVEQTPYFSPFEKVTAKTGLAKLLGKEGGAVPNKSELALLNEIFPPEFIAAAQGNRSLMQKLMSGAGQVLALPRSLMAGGLDMSYGLRQGVFSGYSHPKQWTSAFKEQFKYFGSEKAYKQLNETIKSDPLYKVAREAGLSLTDLGAGRFNPREEQFQSALAEKIPIIGTFVRASGRAYTGFANKYRFDMFKSLVENAKKTGDFADPKFLKTAGELVNTLTGRGSLGPLEKSAGVLSSTLFSPRLLASRIQLMNPQFYLKLQPAVRKEALKSLVGYIAGTSTVLGAAKLAGVDVNTDMTNSDFAKMKFGNTRIDVMGGFQQPLVLLARLLTGKVTSSTTGKTMTLGEGYKPMTRFDIIQRFFESKEAPIVSFITSAIKGQDAVGKPFNISTETIDRMIPMLISDLVDLYKDGGLSSLPLGVPAFFGAGGQTYGKTELVTGKNQLGEQTSQIKPLKGLGESITEKVFGQQPLGTSSGTNVAAYYDQMLKMPSEDAAAKFDEIYKTNPDLAKKILEVHKDRQMGVTVEDQVIKAKGVASGDRAMAVADEFNKLKTPQEKAALWEHYVKIGVITKEVSQQLAPLLQK